MDEIASEETAKVLRTIDRFGKKEITLHELAKSLELFRDLFYDSGYQDADLIHNEWSAIEQVDAVMADLQQKEMDDVGSKIVDDAISNIRSILNKPSIASESA